MANTKENTNLKAQIAELRKTLAGMNVPEDVIEKQVKEITANLVEPVRKTVTDELMKAANAVVKGKTFQQNLEILHGSTMAVYIEVDRKGVVTVRERTVTKRKRSSSGGSTGGKRPILVLNGKEFDSWARLCEAYDLPVGGDSGRRVWERANKENPEKYPMPDEVEKTEDGK